MFQNLLYAANALLILAMIASGVGWFRMLRRSPGMSVAERIDSWIPVRSQERPFGTNADGIALFSTGLIMMFTMSVGYRVGWDWMTERGMIDIERVEETASNDSPTNIVEATESADTPSEETSDGAPRDSAELKSATEESSETATESTTTLAGASAKHRNADSLVASIVLGVLSGLSGMVAALGWLGLFFRNPLRITGLWPQPRDVGLGMRASLLILPPVLLISLLASLLIQYEHPVLNSLSDFAVPLVFIATMVSTAIFTPIFEEFMLRGLFQNGLQRLADPPDATSTDDAWRPVSWWPLVATSLLFAIMHLGQGAAPIPLFFLALGMGFVFRQTGSLTGPIVVHMVLNGMTLSVEFLKIGVEVSR